jgi:hypothetical protein
LKKYAEKDKYGREEVGFVVEKPSDVEMSGTTRKIFLIINPLFHQQYHGKV